MNEGRILTENQEVNIYIHIKDRAPLKIVTLIK